MDKIILKVKDVFGSEIKTRRTIEEFAQTLSPSISYLLDFEGVEQISRSATDELYNIINDFPSVKTVNMSSFVQKMFDAVTISRFNPRQRAESTSEIIKCNTMQELSDCFTALKELAQ
ncbi:MAG: hypothetical protein MJZ24_09560 [Paludibacteraceae bacterium]|nr:hypothetical protein [Paludibacteraceae bacterium]